MKQLSLLLLGILITYNSFCQRNKLSYSFCYDTLNTTLTVELEMTGNKSGKTYLQLPDSWASQKELFKALQFLKVTTKGASIYTTNDSGLRYILHKPSQKLKIIYALKQDWRGRLSYPQNYRAIIQKDYIHLTGYALFIFPQKDVSKLVDIELDWSNLPKNWTIANSLHAVSRTYKGQLVLGDFQNSFYTAGDFRLYEMNVSNKPVYVAVRGNNWKFTDTALVSRVSTIISMQRNFWNDHSEPYYFISLIPFEDQGHYNGSALYQSFMLAMSQEFTIDHYFYSLLTHEYFHRWNGIGFSLQTNSSQEDAWFKEGFTEYYTYKLLKRSGIVSFTDYLEATNRTIAEYYLSPVRNETQVSLGKNFWNTRDYQQIAYKKGFTYALYIDHLIQHSSQGKYSLDNVMHDLYKARIKKKTLTDTTFIQTVKTYSGIDISSSHKDFIILGKTIPVLPESLDLNTESAIKQMGSFDLGFELDASLKAGKVIGIKEQSEAWKAGLRNDQKIVGHSIYFDMPNKPAEISIEENGKTRKVTYLPMSDVRIEVPQFYLKD